MEQEFFSRIEFPIGDTPSHEIFDEFRKFAITENGLVVKGASVAVRHGTPRTAIILTFDEETDTLFRLRYFGRKNITVTNLRKKNG